MDIKKIIAIGTLVIAPVLMGADKCSLDSGGAGGGGGGRVTESPCDAAVADQEAAYKVWSANKTRQNKRFFNQAQKKAERVCIEQGKRAKGHK